MIKIITLLFFTILLGACQATKDALTLKKKNNSDEFLVEKKNPLVLPPDYGELPIPKNIQNKNKNNDLSKTIISLNKEDFSNKKIDESDLSSIEKSIMKEIKKK